MCSVEATCRRAEWWEGRVHPRAGHGSERAAGIHQVVLSADQEGGARCRRAREWWPHVSRMLIERLRRELLGVNFSRTSEIPATYPDQVFVGPMAAILDEYSSSDGDIFPAMFRQARLGPLVGKRSWGGVVGISGGVPLIDGGSINVPTSALASAKGEWI